MKKELLSQSDNLTVTVNSDFSDEILRCYNYLGWECVESRDIGKKGTKKDLVLRRPHVVSHRNERQLLQVYLEDSVNGMAKLFARPCPKTTAFAFFIGVCCLALIGFGLVEMLLFKETMFAFGIAMTVTGALFLIPYSFAIFKMFKAEKACSVKKIYEYQHTIDAVCAAGERLSGGENAR